ncbi:MAG: GvpL/GvpF family gas vesicle protein [Pseudomonadota bacterium]
MKREIVAILPRLPEGSILPERTLAHHFEDWSVVVSTSRIPARFGQALRRQRVQEAPRRLRQLEDLMALGPVLPAIPGASVPVEILGDLCAANAITLQRLCARATGKVQYQITVSWTAADVLDRFRDTAEIAPLFAGSVVTAEAMARAVTRLATRLSLRILSELEPIGAEIVELPTEDGMVCNLVLLIDAGRIPALETAVEAVDAIWPEGFRIQQIGPAPATSFCAFRVRRYGPRSLARARRALDVAPGCTAQDIAHARRTCLRQADASVEGIRTAAEVLTAQARLRTAPDHVYLLELHSEAARPATQQVAIA